MHTDFPVPAAILPAEQTTHALETEAPVDAEYEPDAQLTHSVFPVESWYFPGLHWMQASELAAALVTE